MKYISILLVCLSAAFFRADTNKQCVEDCFKLLSLEQNLSSAHILTKIALSFRDVPYQPNTLEINEEEVLVVNLQAFDCTTFVETCLAMDLAFQSGQRNFNAYCDYLRKIRYRNGIIKDYTSRLHYATDWIYHNDSTGFIRDITKDIGGKILPMQLHYMSSHASAYKALEKHPEAIPVIKEIELAINARTHYYIPKEEIPDDAKNIRTGDIIFFVTSISGLDISHAGIAYRDKGKLTFIHASTKAKKVIVNPESLSEYCKNSKNNRGIMICRMQPVK